MRNSSSEEGSLSRTDSPRNTVEVILDAHFHGQTVRNIGNLIGDGQGDDKQRAINLLYVAVDLDRDKALEFFNGIFSADKRSEDSQEGVSYLILNAISQHCSGKIDQENDPIWRQCRPISSLSDEDLQDMIGDYFRKKTDEYLSANYPVEYQLALCEANKTPPGKSPRASSHEGLQRSSSDRSVSS